MLDYDLLKIAEQSWLDFVSGVVSALGYKYIFQYGQERFNDGSTYKQGENYCLISPMKDWQVIEDEDSFSISFEIWVLTAQSGEQILSAHLKNREIQIALMDALYGSEREATGQFTDERVYSIPLKEFNPDGSFVGYHPGNFLYQRTPWRDISPEASLVRGWALQITATVN